MSLNPKASAAQHQASDPQSPAWVNANAGSGKTHVLVDRVIRLMLAGCDPSRIMCLTFTKAAAAEMANRLFDRLSGWIALDDAALDAAIAALGTGDVDDAMRNRARQLFTRALETPGGLRIQTIHAFCERVLQMFPVEAGIVPHFKMLDDVETAAMLDSARDQVLLSAQSDSDPALAASLRDVADRVQSDQFDRMLRQLLAKRADLQAVLDPHHGQMTAESALRQHLGLSPSETAADVDASLAINRSDYARLADALDAGTRTDRDRAVAIRSTLQASQPTLADLQSFFLTKSGEDRKPRSMATDSVRRNHGWIEDFILAEQQRLRDGLGTLGDIKRIFATLSLLHIGSAIVAAFEQMKRRQGAYDFDDLIIRTGDLLRERPDAAWVLYKLDGGITHLLVDEAQDTSPAQWEIIRSLTDEFFAGEGRHSGGPRTLFVVGDRKQSIYSFQGADPDVFEIVHEDFRQRATDADQHLRDVKLTVSFRSAPEILHAVDTVFQPGSLARKGLDGAADSDWTHESNRRTAQGVVEIWPLVEPLDEDPDDPWQTPVDREPAHAPRQRLALDLARTIKSWIGSRRIVSLDRTVRPEDILILVRSRNSFFDALIRALWTLGVPVAGADRLKLGDNIAVLDLLALAQVALMPEDDHALACLLKSPVIAAPLDEDDLFAIAHGRGAATLWQRLCESPLPRCRAAAEALAPLMAQAASLRPFEFFSAVLLDSRPRFLNRLGREANDAIDAFLDLALSYEENHPTSLAGFVNWFMAAEIEIKRNMEQGTGEVRIMTVHGAKGLEAPIVILPDTTSAPDARLADPLLMLDLAAGRAKVPLWPAPNLFESARLGTLKNLRQNTQTAEFQRLLYVAMTRARDELYICGYRGRHDPPAECWYNTVRDGLTGSAADLQGRWRMGAAESAGPAEAVATPAPAPALPAWVTTPVADAPQSSPAVEPAERLGERRVARGTLVHRILQQAGDLPAEQWQGHVAAAVRRAGYEAELASRLTDLLHNPDFAEVFRPDGLSEVPLIVTLPGGSEERRRIDRLVMTESGLLLVDYKTDRTVPDVPQGVNPEYLQQLAAYRAALRRIHGDVPLRIAILWTETPRLMELPDDTLDMAADHLSVYPA